MPVADPTVGQTNWGTALNARLDDIDARALQIPTPTATKTANYTAVVNDLVVADTTSGAFTVTLPSAPADRSSVTLFLKASAASLNALTFAAGAGDTLDATLSGTLSALGEAVILQYQASTKIWYPIAGRLALSQLAGTSATWSPTFTNVTSGAGTFVFLRVNKRLYVRGTFSGGTATATATIAVSLPAGNTASASVAQPIAADNGAANPTSAPCRVAASGTTIVLWKSNGTTFTAADALTGYTFNGVIEVQ